MSPKRRTVLRLITEGKSYSDICRILEINKSNLHTVIYQMRKQGIVLERREKKNPISFTQKKVLLLYMELMPIPGIANKLQISCQTVMNHATEGFKRLGLNVPGVDRIAALRVALEPKPKPITMDDPFFN